MKFDFSDNLKPYLHVLLPVRVSGDRKQKDEWEGTAKQIELMFKYLCN